MAAGAGGWRGGRRSSNRQPLDPLFFFFFFFFFSFIFYIYFIIDFVVGAGCARVFRLSVAVCSMASVAKLQG
jgi:hypothetical protein